MVDAGELALPSTQVFLARATMTAVGVIVKTPLNLFPVRRNGKEGIATVRQAARNPMVACFWLPP